MKDSLIKYVETNGCLDNFFKEDIDLDTKDSNMLVLASWLAEEVSKRTGVNALGHGYITIEGNGFVEITTEMKLAGERVTIVLAELFFENGVINRNTIGEKIKFALERAERVVWAFENTISKIEEIIETIEKLKMKGVI